MLTKAFKYMHIQSFCLGVLILKCLVPIYRIEGKNKPFFLATGKTGRDYTTLINGAKNIDAELRIIGPKYQNPINYQRI